MRTTLKLDPDVAQRIEQEARENPVRVQTAPHRMPVSRLDEVRAAREPNLKWF